jgi:NAD(P)-dependent dehydrogenase (short-subunit alcohol dehydrogenase family)
MLMKGKVAVIYGGAGAVGRAVATAFAREGAEVFLTGASCRGLPTLRSRSRALAATRWPPRWTFLTRRR